MLSALVLTTAVKAQTVHLQDLDLSLMDQGWGRARKNRSIDGKPLSVGGQAYPTGIGTHAESMGIVSLDGKGQTFTAMVGVDSEVGKQGSVVFQIVLDGKKVWSSKLLKGGDPAEKCEVNVTGAKDMMLVVTDGGDGIDYDHADWIDPTLVVTGGSPAFHRPGNADSDKPIVRTPKPAKTPRLTGPTITGARTNRWFQHLLTATGEKPVKIYAKGMPKGIYIDDMGCLRGTTPKTKGKYKCKVTAVNKYGQDTREFTIVIGDQIALTPPLGWNSWNAFGTAINAQKIEAAATAMVSSGLRDHGWTYVNMDDAWMQKVKQDDPDRSGPGRTAGGQILPNSYFPNLADMTNRIHALGLKAGLYSSPGPETCAGYYGTYQHEDQDAATWARWGFDYIKYDWCSYGGIAKGNSLEELQKPYKLMRASLDKVDRDIVFSLCQYGMGDVSKWGGEIGGNCWRTTGDITDTWGSMSSIGFAQDKNSPYAKPGNWNDPDMLVVGRVGWGPSSRPTRLSPNEQYTHITLWSLLSSPLLIGCDLTELDAFTKGLLTNDEVLAVNQDPLGKAATVAWKKDDIQCWSRPLADGSVAVGVFNTGYLDQAVTFDPATVGVKSAKKVRDLWYQNDLKAGVNTVKLGRHDCVMLRVWPK